MTILGIDPGFSVTGFGILQKQTNNTVILVDYGDLRMQSSKSLAIR
ncbi:crossover junction endodeoxyribonuclease RuvC, partial [Candidatus Dependentiae bacterium]